MPSARRWRISGPRWTSEPASTPRWPSWRKRSAPSRDLRRVRQEDRAREPRLRAPLAAAPLRRREHLVIFDSHMHVGSFESMFRVSLDRDAMVDLMRENEIENGVVFHPDNAYVAEVVESIPGLYALVWANPRTPGYLEEAARFLDHPKFLGMKMHPLLDGFHPNDPSLHPLVELLLDRDLPVLIHCRHPLF